MQLFSNVAIAPRFTFDLRESTGAQEHVWWNNNNNTLLLFQFDKGRHWKEAAWRQEKKTKLKTFYLLDDEMKATIYMSNPHWPYYFGCSAVKWILDFHSMQFFKALANFWFLFLWNYKKMNLNLYSIHNIN